MKRYKFPANDKNFFINYNSGPYQETHCHEYWEFTIITKGRMLHKINNSEHIVHENMLLVLRPDDTHSLTRVDNQDITYINIGVKNNVLKTRNLCVDFLAMTCYNLCGK